MQISPLVFQPPYKMAKPCMVLAISPDAGHDMAIVSTETATDTTTAFHAFIWPPGGREGRSMETSLRFGGLQARGVRSRVEYRDGAVLVQPGMEQGKARHPEEFLR